MFPDLLRDDVFRLETRRLWLRWPRAADAALIANLPHVRPSESSSDFVLRAREGNLTGRSLSLVLTPKQRPGEPIGAICLRAADADEAELGFWLDEAHRGQGFMREAVEALCGLAFRLCDVDAIAVTIPPGEARTTRLLEACGFTPAGGAPQRHVLPRAPRPAPCGAGPTLAPQPRSAIEAGLALE